MVCKQLVYVDVDGRERMAGPCFMWPLDIA